MEVRENGSVLRWAVVTVPVILGLGFLSGYAAQSGPGNAWFDALSKPAIYPPPAAFGIVWSILYVMMGLALAIVLAARNAPGRNAALALFAVQFAFNLAWTPVFFAMHQITGALVVITILDILVVLTILRFWQIDRRAGALLFPYLAWILFATLLNYSFLRSNPEADGVDAAPAHYND